MLITLSPALIDAIDPGPLPGWLQPLAEGRKTGAALIDAVRQVVASMGFASFTYGLTTASLPTSDERFHCLTTAPAAWAAEYDLQGYVEIDPRVQHGWNQVMPLIWDRRIGGGNPRIEAFLERAAAHGIGSGVCVFLHDTPRARAMVGFNSPERDLTAVRTAQVSERLGDCVLLGTVLHAICAREVIAQGAAAAQHGFALSTREVQCLNLAAHGQTSRDIAFKLGITERTANFHFRNILSKLGAMNRSEAIAKAAALGVLTES
jgi:LuxR family transcriptional regulator, quorum-sensing system regulator SolR